MKQLKKLHVARKNSARVFGLGSLCDAAMRNFDLLAVPWVVDRHIFLVYFSARIVSAVIPATFLALDTLIAPRLAVLRQLDMHIRFQAAAARVNLGYLIVGGAVSLAVISCTSFFSDLTGYVNPEFINIVTWAIIAQSSPLLFGATGLLMRVVEQHLISGIIRLATNTMFGVSIVLLDTETAVAVFQALAAAHLTHAALSAVVLTHFGVWPGLTALFHKEIRLF